ncbi:hypothetical protein QVD17_29317 [Tagetes erecta]|uniref:PB1 domain-containing protein n=1 Tax=Tagetes erecta TaxID=13708 RepID=A0AAD8KF06_TARER|nr:hypothetical protein QVD17_29317 [Tagetes erecta]
MDVNDWPQINPDRKAYWPHGNQPEASADTLCKKILGVFSSVTLFPLKRMVLQFWIPGQLSTGNNILLSCSGYPFALSRANQLLQKYRSGCAKYMYCVSGYLADDMVIHGAPAARAFIRFAPEVVLDLSAHRGTPLVDLALECELNCSLMLPVFCKTSFKCVGVIEVSMTHHADLVFVFQDLNRQLQIEGFSNTPPETLPTPSLKHALQEIQDAFNGLSKSHPFLSGHAWHSYRSVSPSNTFLNERAWHSCNPPNTCDPVCFVRQLLGKMEEFYGGDCLDAIQAYYKDLVVIPLENGELMERIIKTQCSLLCTDDPFKVCDNNGVSSLLSTHCKCISLFVCLRSSHTNNLDYVFHFFWSKYHDHVALINVLLLSLKDHLTSFKLASGENLGDDFFVHVDSIGGDTGFVISPSKHETWSRVGMKRKLFDPFEVNEPKYTLPYITGGEDDGDGDDDDDIVFLAVFKAEPRLFFLSGSPTFELFMDKIKREFALERELSPAETYEVKYLAAPGNRCPLTNDTSLKSCISAYRASKEVDYIKLYVLKK